MGPVVLFLLAPVEATKDTFQQRHLKTSYLIRMEPPGTWKQGLKSWTFQDAHSHKTGGFPSLLFQQHRPNKSHSQNGHHLFVALFKTSSKAKTRKPPEKTRLGFVCEQRDPPSGRFPFFSVHERNQGAPVGVTKDKTKSDLKKRHGYDFHLGAPKMVGEHDPAMSVSMMSALGWVLWSDPPAGGSACQSAPGRP